MFDWFLYVSAGWNPYLVKAFFDPQFNHLTNKRPRYCKITKLLKSSFCGKMYEIFSPLFALRLNNSTFT